MESYRLVDLVRKLIGPIVPVGDENIDPKRLVNLRQLTLLVEELIGDIEVVAENVTREEWSMNQVGLHALHFLEEVGENCYGNYSICSKPETLDPSQKGV